MSARTSAAIALLVALAPLGVVAMMTNDSLRIRQLEQRIAANVQSSERFVDIGVRLSVVEAHPDGKELVQGAPLLRVIGKPRLFGGLLDTRSNPPRIVGASRNPQNWYCSAEQWRVIQHTDDEPVGKLALGGMGAGKTTAGVMWLYLRWLECIELNEKVRRQIGVTAPTETRMLLVLDEIKKLWPDSWWKFSTATNILEFVDRSTIRFVSTKRQSEAQGSRIAGFNWSAWLGDELQDQIDEYTNIVARLRAGKGGKGKRLGTATAKDDPRWRTFKDKAIRSGKWIQHFMVGPDSPFVHAAHWEFMQSQMPENEYNRLVLAQDIPSESRLYSAFDRDQNVCPIPIGARKVTSVVLSKKTGDRRDALAMGHDPGVAKAGTVWADAYEVPTRRGEILWWVRGELFTLHKSHEQHAIAAMEITRKRFGCNLRPDEERAHVRCQPLGSAEDKPDLDVFAVWQRVGFHIKAAQYSKQGQGVGQIKKESRIGVVNTLFCNAQKKRRLFIECDDRGVCVAPQLVAALETMERDHLGRPEREEKNVRHDKSDLPAALGYLLWPFEKELAVALRAEIQRGLA